MSLAELQAYYSSPRSITQGYLNTAQKTAARKQKLFIRKLIRAKSKAKVVAKRQYYLTTAYRDMRRATNHNEDIVLATIGSVTILTFAATVSAGEIVLNFFLTTLNIASATGASMLLLSIYSIGVLTVLYGWFGAFLTNLFSISLMDGATRKKIRSLRLTFKKSLSLSSRVACAWLLLVSVIAAPFVIAAIPFYVALQLLTLSIYDVLTVAQYGIIAGIAWILYAVAHYGLVAQVALFEPKELLVASLSRSKSLVSRRGSLFVLSAYFAIMFVLAGSYFAATAIENTLNIDKWLFLPLIAMPGLLLFNGAMAMLYHKRRLSRTR